MPFYKDKVVDLDSSRFENAKIIVINGGTKYLLLRPTHYDNVYKAYELLYYYAESNKGSLCYTPMFLVKIINEETGEYIIPKTKDLGRE